MYLLVMSCTKLAVANLHPVHKFKLWVGGYVFGGGVILTPSMSGDWPIPDKQGRSAFRNWTAGVFFGTVISSLLPPPFRFRNDGSGLPRLCCASKKVSHEHRQQLQPSHPDHPRRSPSAHQLPIGAEPGPPGAGPVGARQHRGGQQRLKGDAARERGAAADIPIAPAPNGAARRAPFVSHMLVSGRLEGG